MRWGPSNQSTGFHLLRRGEGKPRPFGWTGRAQILHAAFHCSVVRGRVPPLVRCALRVVLRLASSRPSTPAFLWAHCGLGCGKLMCVQLDARREHRTCQGCVAHIGCCRELSARMVLPKQISKHANKQARKQTTSHQASNTRSHGSEQVNMRERTTLSAHAYSIIPTKVLWHDGTDIVWRERVPHWQLFQLCTGCMLVQGGYN